MLPTTAGQTLRKSSARPFLEVSSISISQRRYHSGIASSPREVSAKSTYPSRNQWHPLQRPPGLPRAYFGSTTAYSRALAQCAATVGSLPDNDRPSYDYANSKPVRAQSDRTPAAQYPSRSPLSQAASSNHDLKPEAKPIRGYAKAHEKPRTRNHNQTSKVPRSPCEDSVHAGRKKYDSGHGESMRQTGVQGENESLDSGHAIKIKNFEREITSKGPVAIIDAARHAAKKDQWRLALTLLEDAVKEGAKATDTAFQSAGLAILRVAAKRERASPVGTIVVSTLLRLGYQVDIRVFNILMINAVEEGNFLVAWQIWTMLDEIDIKPDVSSFTIILKACRLGRWRDLSKIVLQRARTEGILAQSAHIKTEVLMATVMSREVREERDWKLKFDVLLNTYREFWSLKPLEDLGVSTDASEPASNDLNQSNWHLPGLGPMPGPHVLTIMLQNFMTVAPLGQTQAVYQRFLRLRSEGHPEILNLASTPHVWDALAAVHFRPCQEHEQAKQSLDSFLTLINDMRTPPNLSQTHFPATTAQGYCPPRLPLFSKMLSKCTRSGHLDLAEQVCEAVQQNALRLSKADWLKLLSAYARAQDYDGVIDTLHRMVDAGLQLMQSIGTALVPLKDLDAFLAAVESRSEPRFLKNVRQLVLFGKHYGAVQRRIARNPEVKRTFDPWPSDKINPKAQQALSASARKKFRLAFRKKKPVELDPLLANMLDEDTIKALEATKTDVEGVARKREHDRNSDEDIAKLDDM